MKANELRIGNWVQDEDDIIQYVYRLWVDGAELSEDENGGDDLDYTEDEIFGIPLTEEWLLKFGFEKIDGDYYINEYIASFEADHPLWFGKEGCCQQDTIKDNIKYVHQLQNLYFDLTNKELTRKD